MYDQAKLLDTVIAKLGVRNDSGLCKRVGLVPSVVSKVRSGKAPVSAAILILFHEATGMSISELREVLGDRRKQWRMKRAGVRNASAGAETSQE